MDFGQVWADFGAFSEELWGRFGRILRRFWWILGFGGQLFVTSMYGQGPKMPETGFLGRNLCILANFGAFFEALWAASPGPRAPFLPLIPCNSGVFGAFGGVFGAFLGRIGAFFAQFERFGGETKRFWGEFKRFWGYLAAERADGRGEAPSAPEGVGHAAQ